MEKSRKRPSNTVYDDHGQRSGVFQSPDDHVGLQVIVP